MNRKLTKLLKAVLLIGLLGTGYADATTVTLSPVDDTYVYSVLATTNYGSSPGLASGNLFSGNTLHLWTSFLKFDLTSIPDNLSISGATLYMYQVNGAGFNRTVGTNIAHVADDAWSESTTTWANQPASGAVLDTNPDTADHRGWSQWNLFATGQWHPVADQTDNVLSLAISEVPASSSHNWCSQEADLSNCLAPGETGPVGSLRRPYLEISYIPLPPGIWLFISGMASLAAFTLRSHHT